MAYFKGKKTVTVNLNTDVIANPELTGDEAELTGLQVSNVKYAITQVEANPTLAGTEEDLTGLQIGDTKYAIPSGSGGGVQKTLLYQFSGSSYETLVVSLADTYDYIEVLFSVDSTYSASAIWFSEIYDTSLLDSYTASIFYAFAFNGAYFKYRKVAITATQISIQPCYIRQLSNIGTEISTDKRSLQPYRIYGIKIS